MSDRKATFGIAKTSQSPSHSIDDFNINSSSIKCYCEKYPTQMAKALKEGFSYGGSLLTYCEGEIMYDFAGNQHVDSLPILVVGAGVSQLLKVSKHPEGTGDKQSSAVVHTFGVMDFARLCGSYVF